MRVLRNILSVGLVRVLSVILSAGHLRVLSGILSVGRSGMLSVILSVGLSRVLSVGFLIVLSVVLSVVCSGVLNVILGVGFCSPHPQSSGGPSGVPGAALTLCAQKGSVVIWRFPGGPRALSSASRVVSNCFVTAALMSNAGDPASPYQSPLSNLLTRILL